jgi:hypothetical protein
MRPHRQSSTLVVLSLTFRANRGKRPARVLRMARRAAVSAAASRWRLRLRSRKTKRTALLAQARRGPQRLLESSFQTGASARRSRLFGRPAGAAPVYPSPQPVSTPPVAEVARGIRMRKNHEADDRTLGSVATRPSPRIDRVRATVTAILPAVWPLLPARVSASTTSRRRSPSATWATCIRTTDTKLSREVAIKFLPPF